MRLWPGCILPCRFLLFLYNLQLDHTCSTCISDGIVTGSAQLVLLYMFPTGSDGVRAQRGGHNERGSSQVGCTYYIRWLCMAALHDNGLTYLWVFREDLRREEDSFNTLLKELKRACEGFEGGFIAITLQ